MIPDQSHWVVFCRDEYNDRKLVGSFTRAGLIAEIIAGRITQVRWVVEFNETEGWAKDVSGDFALALHRALPQGEEPRRDIRDTIETYHGVGTVLRAAA